MPVIKLQVEMAHAFLRSALALTSVASAFAQWPSYPTANVPKSADGKPNMNAPAPNTADGHTDFSGISESPREAETCDESAETASIKHERACGHLASS